MTATKAGRLNDGQVLLQGLAIRGSDPRNKRDDVKRSIMSGRTDLGY